MYCPLCESEFRPGFVSCEGCGVALVETLPAEPPPPLDEEDDLLVVVFATAHPMEASMVISLLEGSGVDVVTFDDNTPLAVAVGGIKIAVARSQEVLAREVLEEYRGKAGEDPAQGRVTTDRPTTFFNETPPELEDDDDPPPLNPEDPPTE